jgi:hypothetical protein
MCVTDLNIAAIIHPSSKWNLGDSELVRYYYHLCIIPVHTGNRLDNIGQNRMVLYNIYASATVRCVRSAVAAVAASALVSMLLHACRDVTEAKRRHN